MQVFQGVERQRLKPILRRIKMLKTKKAIHAPLTPDPAQWSYKHSQVPCWEKGYGLLNIIAQLML